MKDPRQLEAQGLIRLMYKNMDALFMTAYEKDMCTQCLNVSYTGNSLCQKNINYLINNFAPLLYGKRTLQS